MPAQMRRRATLTPRVSATATIARPASQTCSRASVEPSSAGTTTRSVTSPSTWLTATVAAPNTAETPMARV